MQASGEKTAKSNSKSDLKNIIKQELKELKSELKNELKNESKNEKESEAYTGHKQIPIKIINKVLESICKITVNTKKEYYMEQDFL